MKTWIAVPALLMALSLTACDDRGSDSAKAVADSTRSIGRSVQEATDKARREMSEGNFKLSASGLPRAEITPEGQLLIDSRDVEMTAGQRTQMLDYRRQLEAIALAGMDIGVAGANLGVKAAGEALKGVFSGNTDGIEAKVNAEADKLKAQANQLCGKLPSLLAAQQQLATSLPAFAPYATMDQSDIDDCGE